jgi:C4-dicarboxylate-specific signal transduction histidine kinase
MSKMIIEENMNGTLQVENSDDGAVFTINLHIAGK